METEKKKYYQITTECSLRLHSRLLFPQPLSIIGRIRPHRAMLLQILIDIRNCHFTLHAGIFNLCHLPRSLIVVGANKHWLRDHRGALGECGLLTSIPFVACTFLHVQNKRMNRNSRSLIRSSNCITQLTLEKSDLSTILKHHKKGNVPISPWPWWSRTSTTTSSRKART